MREALAASRATLHTHVGSFLPYSASILDPWTGFYATRPLLKKRIREAEAALRAAEIAQAGAMLKGQNSTQLEQQLTNARVCSYRVYTTVGRCAFTNLTVSLR